MTSPYIENEATKLCIGSRAESRHSDYHFPRTKSRGSEIEPSPPVESWGRSILQTFFFVVTMIGVGFLLWAIDAVWGK